MNVNQIADVYKMKEMKELERDHLCIPFLSSLMTLVAKLHQQEDQLTQWSVYIHSTRGTAQEKKAALEDQEKEIVDTIEKNKKEIETVQYSVFLFILQVLHRRQIKVDKREEITKYISELRIFLIQLLIELGNVSITDVEKNKDKSIKEVCTLLRVQNSSYWDV